MTTSNLLAGTKIESPSTVKVRVYRHQSAVRVTLTKAVQQRHYGEWVGHLPHGQSAAPNLNLSQRLAKSVVVHPTTGRYRTTRKCCQLPKR
ncbi:hypothetical protein TNCT_78351 [Trichonephila clavata]|uniref:Uncharacterized protein n=1 Tax=Trichonephila clavata TaxID=2740835 RepID=A0A8X6IFX3_TRICU|nr:hypothetical protein TNCT_78351 [Trichonephila clavata]